MGEQKVEISLSLVNVVLQYLGTRPYQEVFNIVKLVTDEVAPQVKNEDKEEI